MPRRFAVAKLLLVCAVLWSWAMANGEEPATQPASLPAEAREAEYTRMIAKRADDILAVLVLNDPAVAERVHGVIVNQYRSLRDLHDARDARIRQLPPEQKEQIEEIRAQTQAAVKQLHQEFLTKLSADLSDEQIEKVKDKMTYNKVQVTYRAYCDMLPNMTDEQKATVLELLKEAREQAMDGGSAEEKTKIFEKYKGKINNYLAKQGYDLKQASRDLAQRRKAQQ